MMIVLIIDIGRVRTLYLIWRQKFLLIKTNLEFNIVHQLVYYSHVVLFLISPLSSIQTISNFATGETKAKTGIYP